VRVKKRLRGKKLISSFRVPGALGGGDLEKKILEIRLARGGREQAGFLQNEEAPQLKRKDEIPSECG